MMATGTMMFGNGAYFRIVRRIGIVFLLCCFSTNTYAQQPTATIRSVHGEVLVSLQGQALVAAAPGTVLRAGDTVQTQAGAQIVLDFSEGSNLKLGQNTHVDIEVLLQHPQTKARQSKIKLFYGKIRAVLAPGHQEKDSSFEIETPNTLAGVKFSQPIIDVSYDPLTETTIIDAHTVDVVITNLKTMRSREIPTGRRGVITSEELSLSTVPEQADFESQQEPSQTEVTSLAAQQAPAEQPTTTQLTPDTLLQSRTSIRQATGSTTPASVGTVGTSPGTGSGQSAGDVGSGAETSDIPPAGVRPQAPERQRRAVIIHFQQD